VCVLIQISHSLLKCNILAISSTYTLLLGLKVPRYSVRPVFTVSPTEIRDCVVSFPPNRCTALGMFG